MTPTVNIISEMTSVNNP